MSLLNTFIAPLNRTSNGDGEPSPARRPRYQVEETESAYGVTVFLPGVTKEGLEITDEEGEFRVTGRRASTLPAGLTALYRESSDTAFELVLAHDGTVDAGKTSADLKDGVLQLTLAKSESAKPRKISVN